MLQQELKVNGGKYMQLPFYFIICDDALLIREHATRLLIPNQVDLTLCKLELNTKNPFSRIGGCDCFAARIDAANLPASLPEGYSFVKLRQLFGLLTDTHYRLALRAAHIVGWRRNNQFCGRCGAEMSDLTSELAVRCTACGFTVYPRISPAIIVAVTNGNQILLARSSRFPPGRFSVIAGFLEPGETLEDCVRRELKEEVGIEVKDICYFGNQPWPFPDSQMIGFTAKYASGELTIDNDEIVAASWFSADKLPDIPPKDSIARQLIDNFVHDVATRRLLQSDV